MQKLVIGFSRPRKWKIFAALIMWWDKYRFKSEIAISHGFGKFVSSTWGRDFIYQAAGHQSHFMGGHRFNEINETVEEYELEIPDEAVTEIGQVCVDREGKGYAIKQVLGQIWVNLVYLGTFGKVQIDNPLADGDAETSCIEEWGRILEQKLGVICPVNLDSTSPKPFRDWIASLPMARRIK